MNLFIFRISPKQRLAKVYISNVLNQFLAVQRTEHQSQIDFIADCAGMLSLFVGTSALSFVEVIYYFTLHLGCSHHRTISIAPSRVIKDVDKKIKSGNVR